MSSAGIKKRWAAKTAAASKRGGLGENKRWRGTIPGISRDGSLHPAIEAAQCEGSHMLMRAATQRMRAQAIEEGEAK